MSTSDDGSYTPSYAPVEERYRIQPSSEGPRFCQAIEDKYGGEVNISITDLAREFVIWHVVTKGRVPGVDLIQRCAAELYLARAGFNGYALSEIATYLASSAFPSE